MGLERPRKIADSLPLPRRGARAAGVPEYTRLVREQSDRSAFFVVLSAAMLLVAAPVGLASAGAAAVLLLVGAIGVVSCAGTLVGWRRRHRAVRVTGWCEATATIGHVGPARPPRGPVVAVKFADGSRIDLRMADGRWSVRALSELPDLPALVGGHGSAMVLLVLPRPPWWTRTRVLAAKAETHRWTPPDAVGP
ncbi:hypothetical protein MUY14_26540 [Amycolatopsis sp. FBCC-B4732]|uniref:hypothetical protein n=1 Tax=Amycolatopsis sp. FBCC-B4732 TaxID=3079339 RepID=UPI001FF2C793|nr:hypothetical protein [Amycolatopsis sp. FBCC-B4732]UOX85344.1 hypothetical protein MUY14_26540 [Amycolatopsis sp. FBCC-B4732]